MGVINKSEYIDMYTQEYTVINAQQYDNGTRDIILTPKDGSEVLSLLTSDWIVQLLYNKPDGTVGYNDATINIDGTVTIHMTGQMLAVAGKVYAQLLFTNRENGENQIQSTKIVILVNDSIARTSIESSDDFSALSTILASLSTAYEQVETLIEMGADITQMYNNCETALNNANQAISTANSINSTASQSANEAAQSATNASTSESNALSYKNSAESAKNIATTKASEASTSATNASTSATNASTSESNALTYKNNAESARDTAITKASEANISASNASTSETNASTSASTATTQAGIATTKASEVLTSAINANNSALDSEAWSVGKRNGVDVDSNDETYHNNAKYYKELAQAVSAVEIATDTTAGIVKGSTDVSVGADGTMSVNFPTSLPASDVYDWAKAENKPSYNASEVGALASDGTANRATADANGNVITDTYVQKSGSNIGNGVTEVPLGIVGTTTSWIAMKNSTDAIMGYVGCDGMDSFKFALGSSPSDRKTVLHSGNVETYALPITGGTVTGVTKISNSDAGLFKINRIGNLPSYVTFYTDDTYLGRIGVSNNGTSMVFINQAEQSRFILHSGNIGTYALPISGGTLSGSLTAPTLRITGNGGDEGGQINLIKAPNSTLSGDILIDVYKNTLRAFAEGGGGKGVYLDLAECTSISNKVLHTGNSSPIVTTITAPTVGASSTYADGTVIVVYE